MVGVEAPPIRTTCEQRGQEHIEVYGTRDDADRVLLARLMALAVDELIVDCPKAIEPRQDEPGLPWKFDIFYVRCRDRPDYRALPWYSDAAVELVLSGQTTLEEMTTIPN